MQRLWFILILPIGTLAQVIAKPVPHNNLRHKNNHHRNEAAEASWDDTSVHGDKEQQYNKPEEHHAIKEIAQEDQPAEPARRAQSAHTYKPPEEHQPVRYSTPKASATRSAPRNPLAHNPLAQHLLARQHAQDANIPGVDYGDVKYPDLMNDIDDLFNDLKNKKDEPKEEQEKHMKEAAKKVKKTQEAAKNVTEVVEKHAEEQKAAATKIEYIGVDDCINAFRHRTLLKRLKEMHPAELEGDPGIIDYDIQKMCQTVAVNGTISKRNFVSGFLNMVQKRVNNKPIDCESFAYYVMSGGAFDELGDENRHLAIDNIDLAKLIERARLGPDAPPLPKPKLQDIMLWQLGKREDPTDEAHAEMDEVHKALEEGDSDAAMSNLKDLKKKMGDAQQHLKEKASAHGWSIKRESVEAGVKGENLPNGTLHMGTNDTLARLGSNVDEQLANFDKCDADGNGELWEKEYLVCELKRVEDDVVQELKATGEGVRSPGHHCAWRLGTLTSGRIYQQTEDLNSKLRMMNQMLHENLRELEGEEKYMKRRTKKVIHKVAGPAGAPGPAAAASPAPAAPPPAALF